MKTTNEYINLSKLLIGTKSSLKEVTDELGMTELTEFELDTFRENFANDCEFCGEWSSIEEVCHSSEGELICEDCKDLEE